jgi:acetylornithine deacetylase/succinyl-diaminopimelate desuccinylase-like protein
VERVEPLGALQQRERQDDGEGELVADEEAGCSQGSLAIAKQHPEWLRGSVAITEVGGFTTYVDKHRIYPVQVAEKGFVWLRLHIEGTPGHGSMPSGEGAVDELARIVTHLSQQPFDFRCTQPVQDFLEGVAEVLGFPRGTVFKSIGNKTLSGLILEKLVKDPGRTHVFRALLRDTVSPTMAQGGTKANVIPSSAVLTLDCRILPGTDPDAFIAGFQERVPGNYTIEVIDKGPAVVMDPHHPVLGIISDILREADPGSHPVPQMITGFTDARAFDEVHTPCYGFSPVWLPPDIPFASLFHGHNERIPVEGFRWGQACLLELARRLCTTK